MKIKPKLIALTLITLTPILSFGVNNSIAKASGMSDALLFSLLISIILLLLFIILALSKSIKSIAELSNFEEAKNKGEDASNKKFKAALSLAILSLISFSTLAQNNTHIDVEFVMGNTLFWILISIIIILSVFVFILYKSLKSIVKLSEGEDLSVRSEGFFGSSVPIEDEEEIMLDHVYDGIRELDNDLPPWWVYLFYATIIFSVIYLIRYQVTGHGLSGVEEYELEMAKAAAQKEQRMAEIGEDMITEDNVTFLSDEVSINAGEAIYKRNCASCHGQLGEGGAGPNLSDKYWIHGGSIQDIFSVIKYGVPEKGMIAWESIFKPEQIQEVASYIMTLEGTNPPNPKAPEGDLYEAKELKSKDKEDKVEEANEEIEKEEA